MVDATPRRRLTDADVRQILRLHTRKRLSATVIAAQYGVHPNAIYDVIHGRTHKPITKGRNRSVVGAVRANQRAEVARIFAETRNKAETARRTGLSRPLVHYYLKENR